MLQVAVQVLPCQVVLVPVAPLVARVRALLHHAVLALRVLQVVQAVLVPAQVHLDHRAAHQARVHRVLPVPQSQAAVLAALAGVRVLQVLADLALHRQVAVAQAVLVRRVRVLQSRVHRHLVLADQVLALVLPGQVHRAVRPQVVRNRALRVLHHPDLPARVPQAVVPVLLLAGLVVLVAVVLQAHLVPAVRVVQALTILLVPRHVPVLLVVGLAARAAVVLPAPRILVRQVLAAVAQARRALRDQALLVLAVVAQVVPVLVLLVHQSPVPHRRVAVVRALPVHLGHLRALRARQVLAVLHLAHPSRVVQARALLIQAQVRPGRVLHLPVGQVLVPALAPLVLQIVVHLVLVLLDQVLVVLAGLVLAVRVRVLPRVLVPRVLVGAVVQVPLSALVRVRVRHVVHLPALVNHLARVPRVAHRLVLHVRVLAALHLALNHQALVHVVQVVHVVNLVPLVLVRAARVDQVLRALLSLVVVLHHHVDQVLVLVARLIRVLQVALRIVVHRARQVRVGQVRHHAAQARVVLPVAQAAVGRVAHQAHRVSHVVRHLVHRVVPH